MKSHSESPVIYVAGSILEVERAKKAIDQAKHNGLRIINDWPSDPKTDRDHWSDGTAHVLAAKQLYDVRGCDAFWLLIPHEKSFGCGVEFGTAITSGVFVVASGNKTSSIFASLCKTFSDDSLVIPHLLEVFGWNRR